MSNRFRWLFAGIFALSAVRLQAQASTSVAVDATFGAASGKGGEFFDRDMGGVRLAASVRRWSRPGLGMFGELSLDVVSLTMGHKLVCYPNPRGGCLDAYPEFWGPAAVVGLVGESSGRKLEGRVGLGGGAYLGDGTRVGAIVTQADGAMFPFAHVGLTVGMRWIVVPRFRHDRLSMMPWAVGVRIR